MKCFKKAIGLFVFLAALNTVKSAEAVIIINELLADPPVGLSGDANGDGVGSTTNDEFIELLNFNSTAIDISGWSISDALSSRHVFPVNTLLAPYSFLVVFGGGNPDLPGVHWQKASTGTLSLNNTGETVSLFDKNNGLIDRIIYGSLANNDQSITRFPEAPGSGFVLHSGVAQAKGKVFSAGTAVDGRSALSPATVPDASTLGAMGLGFFNMLFWRKLHRRYV